MRRKKGLAIAVILVVLLTAGCGKQPQTVVPGEETGAQEETQTVTDPVPGGEEAAAAESMPAEAIGGQDDVPEEEASGQQASKEENQEKGYPEKDEKTAEEAPGEGPVEETVPGEGTEGENAKEETKQQGEASDSALTAQTDPGQAPQAGAEAALLVEEQTVVIPGLEKEYNYLFLSDTHIICLDGEETQQQLDNAIPRQDTLFKDAWGRTPEEVFPAWMAYANEQQVDGLLLGGDIIDFPSRANLAFLEENLETLEMPYLYVPGNHDWTYPWEYMTDKGRQEYLTALAPWMHGTPAAQLLENEELVLLGVDNSSNQIDPAALDTVKSAIERGKPVIVLQHIPFATDRLVEEAARLWQNPVLLGKGVLGGIYPNEVSQEYMNLVLADAGPVKAVLAGHIHMGARDSLTEGILQYTADAGYLGKGLLLTIRGEEKTEME